MSPFKDLIKIVNGVALVALEATKRSEPIAAIRGGDLQTLVPKTLKSALTSATDITGLTKGSPREVSAPKVRESSVVYFTDPKHDPDDAPNVAARSEPVAEVASIEDNGIGVVAAEEEVKIERKLEYPSGKVENVVQNLSGKVEEKAKFMNDKVVGNENVKVLNVVDEKKESKNEKVEVTMRKRRPRERRVPSTPFTRFVGFAGLGAGLAWGTVQESAKRIVYGTPTRDENQPAYSAFLSDQNAERLALALCRMRGAALKLGQMLSIQDESLVPAPILAALEIVRQGADVMPRSQLNEVLNAELGPDWPTKLRSFDYEPLAAASIGQVHRAVLKNGTNVAMKIQYPGVADSIESDIENVRRLLNYTNLIPEGLFLDSAIKVAKEELARECNYILEAQSQKRFRELLSDSEGFYVPEVVDEISSMKVLTTELVSGVPIDNVALLNQETRNYVGTRLLELTLKELFLFRFMQTDPNWSNFLYDDKTKMINLIDFGAARDFPQNFVDDYLRMVMACANKDRDAVIKMSKRLGFLTGDESEVMLDAHVQAGFIVGIPFSTDKEYDFRSTNITHSISNLGATMLKHRLTPPPDEAYSLHRKLSGAFLACIKLKAVVPCREVLMQIYQKYQFSDDDAEFVTTSAS